MSIRHFKNALLLSAALGLSGCAGMVAPSPVHRGDLGAGLEEGPTPAARHVRAVAAFDAGQFGNAVDGFRQLLAHTPGDVAALNGLGASYDRLGRPDLAARYYERALAIEPASVQTLNNLGYSHLMNRRADLAFVYLARAYATAREDLVVVNNYEAALYALERVPDMAQLASAAPVQPVSSVPLPPAGSYALERVTGRVQALVATAPDPASRQSEVRPDGSPPARRPSEVRLASPEPASEPTRRPTALDSVPPIVVANGTGRARMARRLADHLTAQAFNVVGLANADRFDRLRSTVYHAPDQAEAAALLARKLPADVAVVATPESRGVLRLELGADLLGFDADLLRAKAASAPTRSVDAGVDMDV